MSLFFRELSNKLVSCPFIIASNKNLLFLKIFRTKTSEELKNILNNDLKELKNNV